MSKKSIVYNPDEPMQVVRIDGNEVIVLPVSGSLPPGIDYSVDVSINPADTGPGGASDCLVFFRCRTFEVL